MEKEMKNPNVLSDEELKNVTGGNQTISFGGFGFTWQTGGERVKMIDGSKCPSCGSTHGVTEQNAHGGLCVKCSCGATIQENLCWETVERY